MRKLPEWMTTPQTVSGEWLQLAGLALPILDPESAILIGLQRVDGNGPRVGPFEEYTMNPTACTHKNNPNFWIFGLFFFLYFSLWPPAFRFCQSGYRTSSA